MLIGKIHIGLSKHLVAEFERGITVLQETRKRFYLREIIDQRWGERRKDGPQFQRQSTRFRVQEPAFNAVRIAGIGMIAIIAKLIEYIANDKKAAG